MRRAQRILFTVLILGTLTGCLKTRSQLRKDVNTGNVNTGNMRTDATGTYVAGRMDQQQRAQIDSRFFEIDRDFRELYGKIETLERKLDDAKTRQVPSAYGKNADSEFQVKALEKRITIIEEALLALDQKIDAMGGKKPGSAKVMQNSNKTKGPFGYGEILFARGQFAQAIVSYDRYRKNYPRGRRYAQATLKMAMAFQRLKKNNDAKVFYKEVIQRYPNTQVSLRAQKNLKKL